MRLQKRWKEYNKNRDYSKIRKSDKYKKRQEFYNSSAWRRIKEMVMSASAGLDEVLLRQGRIVPANQVHHIIPLSEDFTRALDKTNLIALSAETHSMIHSLYKEDEEVKRKVQQRLMEYVADRRTMKLSIPPGTKCFWD